MEYVLYALIAVLIIISFILGYFINSLSNRLAKLTTGTNGKNLEDAIYKVMEDHTILAHRTESLEATTGRLDSEIKSSIRGVATVRFNAFADVGGKQSFATAVISEDGNGFVISSVYTRDRMNVYAKPIVDFSSEYELSVEEARALKEAAKIYN
jgi:hypothetical protein